MKIITTNLLNRFWQKGVKPIKTLLGSKDISKIGDGTVTGAIVSLNSNIGSKIVSKTYIISLSAASSAAGWNVNIADMTGYQVVQHSFMYRQSQKISIKIETITETLISGFYTNSYGNIDCTLYVLFEKIT